MSRLTRLVINDIGLSTCLSLAFGTPDRNFERGALLIIVVTWEAPGRYMYLR